MRIALVLASLLMITACSRKPDVYSVTSPAAVAPAVEAPADGS